MGKASHNKPQNFRVAPARGLPLMSAALIDLVEPMRHEDLSLEECQVIIMLGSLAWNLSLFPKSERKAQMQAFFNAGKDLTLGFHEIVALGSDEEVTDEPNQNMNLIQLVKALIHRKEWMFPDDRRMVSKTEVTWKNDKFYVTASSLPVVPLPGESAQA